MSIHGVVSDTGLVRGVGLYTHSELTFGEKAKVNVYELSAGNSLYSLDTSTLAAPYNPTVAKPFHVIWTRSQDGMLFNSSISGHPMSVHFACIFGRDGAEDEDWTVTMQNEHCVSPSERNVAVVTTSVSSTSTLSIRVQMFLIAASIMIIVAVSMFRAHVSSKAKLNENEPLLRQST